MQLCYYRFLFSFFCLILLASCQSNQESSHSQAKNVTTLAPLSPFDASTIDGLLVSVSDQAILLSDFQHVVVAASNGQTYILPSGKLVGGTMTPVEGKQLLESLVNQKVLQLKAIELGMDVSEEELSHRIRDFLIQEY